MLERADLYAELIQDRSFSGLAYTQVFQSFHTGSRCCSSCCQRASSTTDAISFSTADFLLPCMQQMDMVFQCTLFLVLYVHLGSVSRLQAFLDSDADRAGSKFRGF